MKRRALGLALGVSVVLLLASWRVFVEELAKGPAPAAAISPTEPSPERAPVWDRAQPAASRGGVPPTAEPAAAAIPDARAAAARRAADAAEPLPQWLRDGLGEDDDGATPAVWSNRQPLGAAGGRFEPDDLAALEEIIAVNRLTESTTRFDFDDGDGVLEPLELGFQAWDASGRLVALSLGPDPFWSFLYDLTDLPPSVGDLTALRVLDLHGNRLAELPEEIGRLGALRELRLQRNRLTRLPASIGDLTSLRVLLLGDNALRELPESMGQLRSLEQLDLGDNPVRLTERVADLTALRVLDVGRDRARRTGMTAAVSDGTTVTNLPEGVGSLPELETLFVADGPRGCGSGLVAGFRVGDLLPGGSDAFVFGFSSGGCGRF